MKIEVSVAEIIDKLSILTIKKNNISDPGKLENIKKEYDYLYIVVFNELRIKQDDFLELVLVNERLWDIEDKIRDKELKKEFDSVFVELARSVYITNDKRSDIKKEINLKYGSLFVEEKSYNKY